MKQSQNNRLKTDFNSRFIAVLFLSLIALTLSSCSAIAGIFEAGMGFGMYLVLAVLVVLAFIILRIRQKK